MNRLKAGPASKSGQSLVVETTTVDGTAKAMGKWPNLLKIDVEGAEEAVLIGAKEALKKSVRGVFMEIHHSQAEAACRALLEQAGYECVWKEYEWGNYANQVMFLKK